MKPLRWLFVVPICGTLALSAAAQDRPGAAPSPPPLPSEAPKQEPPKEQAAEPKTEKKQSEGLKFGWLFADVQGWESSPSANDFVPVYVLPTNTSPTSSALRYEPDWSTSYRYSAGIQFKNPAWGGFEGWYWEQNGSVSRTVGAPGDFVFYEAMIPTGLAGYKNDGLADGFLAIRSSSTRDYRIDHFRTAVDTEKVGVTWSFGYRRVTHRESNEANYYAMVPTGFPTLINPGKPELLPRTDVAGQYSQFSGNGLDLGANFRFQLHPRVTLESGLTAGVLWGRLAATYTATTYAYVVGQGQPGAYILPGEDYAAYFTANPDLDGLSQVSFPGGIQADASVTAQCYEAYVSVRYRVWQGLVVSGGFRVVRYDGIAGTIRPTDAIVDLSSELLRIPAATVERRSVAFNGLWLGVGYRY